MRTVSINAAFVAAVFVASGYAAWPASAAERPGRTVTGEASWYGGQFHGRRTASGERFDMHELTAAHRSLPFGSTVRVTNRHNNKSVVVRINDRGPYSRGRLIDLSRGAARAVRMLEAGVAPVKIEVLQSGGS